MPHPVIEKEGLLNIGNDPGKNNLSPSTIRYIGYVGYMTNVGFSAETIRPDVLCGNLTTRLRPICNHPGHRLQIVQFPRSQLNRSRLWIAPAKAVGRNILQ